MKICRDCGKAHNEELQDHTVSGHRQSHRERTLISDDEKERCAFCGGELENLSLL